MQMKNKQTTYIVNITLRPGAFTTFPEEMPSRRFSIGLKNALKLLALFGKTLTTQLELLGEAVVAVRFRSETNSHVPVEFLAQVLQTRVNRVRITKDFEPVAKGIDSKTLQVYLSALDGSGPILLRYDGHSLNFESSNMLDSTSSKIGQAIEGKQLSLTLNKPLKLVLEFLTGQKCDLAYASNVLRLTSQTMAMKVQLLLSIK